MPIRPLTLRTDPVVAAGLDAERVKATLVQIQAAAEGLGTRIRRVRLDQIETHLPALLDEWRAMGEALAALLPAPPAPEPTEEPAPDADPVPAEVPEAAAPTTPKPRRKPRA